MVMVVMRVVVEVVCGRVPVARGRGQVAVAGLVGPRAGHRAARVVLVQVVLQSVPSASHSHHDVVPQNSNKNDALGVADPVFALADLDHWKLVLASALARDGANVSVQVALKLLGLWLWLVGGGLFGWNAGGGGH